MPPESEDGDSTQPPRSEEGDGPHLPCEQSLLFRRRRLLAAQIALQEEELQVKRMRLAIERQEMEQRSKAFGASDNHGSTPSSFRLERRIVLVGPNGECYSDFDSAWNGIAMQHQSPMIPGEGEASESSTNNMALLQQAIESKQATASLEQLPSDAAEGEGEEAQEPNG